jgi:LPXTG-site transpeptidase (sortase) family protein
MFHVRLPTAIVLLGLSMFAGGAGMRVVARINMAQTQARLLAARPNSPADMAIGSSAFEPADSPPSRISLPSYGLWNTLQAVDLQAEWRNGQISMAWNVADAGWHQESAWPGWKGNVVIAGHSPSLDPQTWPRSIFRQLAYLNTGDRVDVTAGDRVYTYAVSNVFLIPGSEAETANAEAWLDRGTVERLTIITCWPPQTAAYRVVVIAQPVSQSLQE